MSQGTDLTESQVEAVRRALLVAGFSVADASLVFSATNATEQLKDQFENFSKALNETARKLKAFELQALRREFPNPIAKAKSKSKSKHQRRRERGW